LRRGAKPQPQTTGQQIAKFFKELPILIALAIGIALFIKGLLVQAFFIEQHSMDPTLHPGDRVLVSKLSYRFGDPGRGDVVIFHDPRDPCRGDSTSPECNPSLVRRGLDWFGELFGLPTSSREDLVKRIVALPGETVQIQDGDVYICRSPGCRPLDESGAPTPDTRLVTIPTQVDRGPQKDDDSAPALQLLPDQYYMLGDNRAASADSRSFGAVPRSSFVGKGFLVLWPPGHFRGL
jgi:signal peptidase I